MGYAIHGFRTNSRFSFSSYSILFVNNKRSERRRLILRYLNTGGTERLTRTIRGGAILTIYNNCRLLKGCCRATRNTHLSFAKVLSFCAINERGHLVKGCRFGAGRGVHLVNFRGRSKHACLNPSTRPLNGMVGNFNGGNTSGARNIHCGDAFYACTRNPLLPGGPSFTSVLVASTLRGGCNRVDLTPLSYGARVLTHERVHSLCVWVLLYGGVVVGS